MIFRGLGFVVVLGMAVWFGSCQSNDEPVPVDCEKSTLALVVTATGNASDCASANGFIHAAASGGKSPYSYVLNDLSPQSSSQFNNVKAGVYTLRVIDAEKCERLVENIFIQSDGFAVDLEITPDNECLDGNGSITVNVLEGEAPFQYKIGTGAFSANNVFEGLQKGRHKITVQDNAGCSANLDVSVPHGFTGTSWSDEILPIVEVSCSISGCHDGVFQPDLRIYANAKFYASLMKQYTQDKSMPFDGSIPQSQIDLIACWVDDGALDN